MQPEKQGERDAHHWQEGKALRQTLLRSLLSLHQSARFLRIIRPLYGQDQPLDDQCLGIVHKRPVPVVQRAATPNKWRRSFKYCV